MEVQAKVSQNSGEEIPNDLLIDIFSRVPAKNIARCRCVSKLWRSILSQPDFKNLFLTMSSTRRRMFLFTIENRNNIYFFSAPEPENPDEKTCLVVQAARYHVQKKHSPSPSDYLYGIRSLYGFVFLRRKNKMVICNPATGESVSLPEVEDTLKPFLGYNPIENQFKVLCIQNYCHEHLVLTLDDENHSWRRNHCKLYYNAQFCEICIDSILYYHALFSTDGIDWENRKIVCFHVRSEKFSFINVHKEMDYFTLINYKGKLAALRLVIPSKLLHGHYWPPSHLKFWVLEDAEKHIWSKRSYTFPPLLDEIFYYKDVNILGMTGRGEVVLAFFTEQPPLCICYFNLETNHITRIQIQGLKEFEHSTIRTCLGYAENLKLMCPALRLDK